MNLEPYRREHLNNFQPSAHDAANLAMLRMSQGWEGRAIAGVEDGRTLGIGGIAVMGATAHVWLVLSDEARRRPVALTKVVRFALAGLPSDVDIVKAEVDEGFAAARRWAARLGFEPEGERLMVWRLRRE